MLLENSLPSTACAICRGTEKKPELMYLHIMFGLILWPFNEKYLGYIAMVLHKPCFQHGISFYDGWGSLLNQLIAEAKRSNGNF